MSQIRRQSIISALMIFLGFGIGFINNLFFTRQDWFTPDQYGLTRSFFDFSTLIYAFSFWGVTAVIYKFFPFYEENLEKKDNDLLSWALIVAIIGFLIFTTAAIFFKPFFQKKFEVNSKQLVTYYYWLFPFGLSILLFNILEVYCQALKKSIIGNFLRETLLRILTLALVLLFVFKIIKYDTFIKIFALLYSLLVLIQMIYLYKMGHLNFTVTPSKVTKKFFKKMLPLAAYVFVGSVIITIAATFDSIVISSKIGQNMLAVFAISSYMSNIIQIPQRSIVGIAIPHLSEAWKHKNYGKIEAIYKRSSINLLMVSLFIFGNIWLCYDDIITFFKLNPIYLQGKYVVFFLAIKIIIDMGTGVNAQIIATSNYWRFEFITGVVLLLLIIPLNYILIPKIGIVGAGVSNLVAYTIYNIIRLIFLWKKFKMQPFSMDTLKVLAIAMLSYFLCYFLLINLSGWQAILFRGSIFSILILGGYFYFNCSPDTKPVIETIKKRFGIKKQLK
jgi:O-antigen/teichoic acid export membrane protein